MEAVHLLFLFWELSFSFVILLKKRLNHMMILWMQIFY